MQDYSVEWKDDKGKVYYTAVNAANENEASDYAKSVNLNCEVLSVVSADMLVDRTKT